MAALVETSPGVFGKSERGNWIRGCVECDAVDDGPRHTHAIMSPAAGDVTTYRHIECCAATGCPTCTERLQSESTGD